MNERHQWLLGQRINFNKQLEINEQICWFLKWLNKYQQLKKYFSNFKWHFLDTVI